jgi:hypothetical protein
MKLKRFTQFINESEEAQTIDFTSDNPGSDAKISYKKPTITIAKVSKPKVFNQLAVTNTSGKTWTYEVLGYEIFKGQVDLNFKYIDKKSDGSLVFGRYVSGGVEDTIIPMGSQLIDLLNKLAMGQNANPVPGLNFKRV